MPDSVNIIAVAADMAAPAFFHMLALAALGAAAIAICCEFWGRLRQKTFSDKYAQQVSSMSMLFFLFALAVGVAGAFAGKTSSARLLETLNMPGSPAIPLAATLGAALTLSVIYSLTWNKTRETKFLHISIGIPAAICSLCSVVLIMDLLRGILPLLVSENTPVQWPALPAANSPIWPTAVRQISLALAFAGALSLAYLIHRRKKDDFGRDYYGFGLTAAAKWALFPALAALACQGWQYALSSPEMQQLMLKGTLAPAWWGTIGATIFCCLLWTLLARSAHPMRLKGAALAGSVLVWAINALDMTLNMNILLAG